MKAHSAPTSILKHVRSYKRVSTLVAALVLVGVVAAGFMVVSGRAAALGFHLPASVSKIFGGRIAARTAPAAAPRTISASVITPLAPFADVVIAGWDLNPMPGGLNNFGTSPLSPTSSTSNVIVGSLTRGAGVTQSGTGAARGWGGTGWASTTSAAAITANTFFTFTVKANTGFTLSLGSMNPFDYRRSGTGPPSALIQYQLNAGIFTDITTVSFPTTTSGGDHVGSTDLSGISALQNLPSTTTVTFRVVPFNASAAGGTFYLWDFSNTTAIDFAVNGTTAAVDNTPPAAPVITGSSPASPSTNQNPNILGTAEALSTVKLFTNPSCSGSPIGTGPADGSGNFSIGVTVTAYATTNIKANATDLAGNISVCTTTPFAYTHVAPDMTFNASGDLAAGTYHDVTINNCGTFVNMTGNVTITGTLRINDCAHLQTNSFIVSGSGVFVLAASGWLHIGDANGITTSPTLSGSIQTGARIYSPAAVYVYTGTGNQAVGNGLPSTVANLLISNTGGSGSNTVTGNSGQVVGVLLEIISGVYSSASDYADVQIDLSGTLSLTGPITVSGNWTNSGTFTPNGFGVTFDGSEPQSIGGSSATGFAGFTDSNTSAAVTFNTNFNVSGTFNMNGAGTLFTPGSASVQVNSAGSTGTISGTGRVQVTLLSGNTFSGQYRFSTFSVTALTVEWAGAGNQNIENGVSGYGGIRTSGSGTKTIGGSGTLAINGEVTIGSGTTLAQGANSLNVAGNWSNSGTFTPGTSAVGVTFNGSGNTQTISGTNTFSNLTINHTGLNGVTAAGSTLSVTGLLRVQLGTFTSATQYADVQIDAPGTLVLSGAISVSGNWTNNGTFTHNNFGVTFNGAGAQTITTGGSGAGKQFNGLTVSNSSGGTTVSGNLAMGSTSPLGLSYASGTPTVSMTGGAFALAVGNPVTVTTTSALGAGDYVLISAGSGGSVTGTAPTNLTMAGSGLASGTSAVLQITGSQLVLHVVAVPPPTVTTNAANPVGTTTATLNGSANPNGAATTGWFRYGTVNPGTCNDAFGTRAPASGGTSLGSGSSGVSYSQGVTGLSSGQTYYFCAIASNGGGTSVGSVLSFTTPTTPTLGNYTGSTVALSSNPTYTPDAVPTNTTSITASTDTNFKGTFAAKTSDGAVSVTDAHPAGVYTVTVKAIGPGGSTTKTFTLTVTNGTACSGNPSFTNASDVAGTDSWSLAVGDFNGDGKQDLASASVGLDSASIRLGNGDGTFSSSPEAPVGSHPQFVAVGDFNGDGKQDLVTANVLANTVSIRLGNGDGTFSGTNNPGVGSNPISIAVGDFNGDGKQDLAVANQGSTTVSIRLGNGDGTFSNVPDVSVQTTPDSIVVGDFNTDSILDLAVANYGSDTVSIRLGVGDGTFGGVNNVTVGSRPTGVVVGDFNGDTKQDIAAVNSNSNPLTAIGSVSIRLGDGAGNFAITGEVVTGLTPFAIAVGDFNNDSKQDLVVTSQVSNAVSIYLGNGAGGFGANQDVATTHGGESVVVGDFNADGKQDIANNIYFGSATPNGLASIRLGGCTPVVNLSVDTNVGTEAAGTVVTVTATASDPVVGAQTVSLGVSGTNITAGDYTLSSSTITIPNGGTTGSVTFTVVDDAVYEGPETATLTISSPSSGIALGATTTQNVAITDNDTAPSFSINDLTQAEGNGGPGTTLYTFTITKTGATELNSSVDYETVDGTATSPSDFTAILTTNQVFLPADASKPVTVLVNGDTTFEANEAFSVLLTNASGATIADNSGTGTITNDDTCGAFATVYVDDSWVGTPLGSDPDVGGPATVFGCDSFATIQEGVNAVTSGGTVIVRAGTYTENVTVPNGKSLNLLGANAGISANPDDLATRVAESIINGRVTLDSTLANTLDGFTVQSPATGVTVSVKGNSQTVVNNIVSGSGTNSVGIFPAGRRIGLAVASFTISRNNISGTTYGVEIDGSGADYSASGVDSVISGNYISNTTSIGIFPQNVNTGLTRTFRITGNAIVNNNNGGMFLPRGQFAITGNRIQNNTGYGIWLGTGTLALSDLTVTGNTITGNGTGVRLDGTGTTTGLSINFNRITGNTTSGINSTRSGTPGSLNAENNWWGCNTGPGGAATGGCAAVPNGIGGTNAASVDANPWIVLGTSASPNPIGPGGTSTVTADMTKNSDAATPAGGPVPLIPVAFTATQGTMTPPASTITGGTATSLFASTSLLSGTGCAMVDGQNTCTNITVTLPSFSIDDVTHLEGNGGPGSTSYIFTITKTGATAFSTNLDYATVNGTATAPSDFTALLTTNVIFSPTDTIQQFTVLVNGDTMVEANEAFTVHLSNVSAGATISDADGTGTITNDDTCPPFATVYVDDDWAAVTPGTDPDAGGPATNFGCDSFATIQEGVNAVTSGGTVIVNDGTYTEYVTITKPLTLTGAGAATVTLIPPTSDPNCGGGGGGALCAGATNLILVQANNVTISGLTLDGDNPALSGGDVRNGINVNAVSVDARNGIITDHNTGIFENLVVHDVTVKNVFLRGIYASSGGSFNFHHNTVRNVAGDVASSIAMFNFGGVGTFDNNTVLDSNDGIASNASLGTQYTNNHVSNCASGGIHTDNAGDGPIVSNDLISANIVDNSPVGGFGIYAYQPRATVTIQNNTVTNVDNGLASFGRLPSTGSLPLGNIKEGAAQTAASATARPRVIDVREPGAFFLKHRATSSPSGAINPDATIFTGNTVSGGSVGVTLTTDQLGNGSGDAGITFNQNTVIANTTGVSLATQDGFTLTVAAAFNRLVSTTNAFSTAGTGTLNATMENNWWGCNAGPGFAGCGLATGTGVDFDPWIVLGVTALPSSIPPFTNSNITADMTKNSNNVPAGGTLPDIPVAWSAVNGTMSPTNGTVVASTASSTFTSTSTSSGSACAMVDNQLTCANVTIFPTTVTIVPAPTPTAADNDYTRINNAVQATFNGQTIKLLGTFNWTEPFAAASWSRGSNDIGGDLDDYSILVPANINNVTFTADNLGDGTIQGPGDLPGLDLEGVFFFNGGDNQNWTISNISFLDFDLSIGMFNGAGGSDAFNGTTITNNYIRMARDAATAGDTFQNIAIYYSFGTNQTITGNTIDIQGDAVTVGGNNAADVGMQCDMSGGNVYNGLQITNNTIHVLNAQSADPEVIIGIWENGLAHLSNITVSGNTFTNQGVGNNPATNIQRGFRVTSHSSATTTVTYQNNTVSGANIGFQWLAGSNFSGNLPVVVKSNTITGNGTGVLVQSQGRANLSFNRIVGNTVTGLNNLNGTVTAENNWWGCNAGPGNAGCDTSTPAANPSDTAPTVADFNPWLVLAVSAVPSSMNPGGTSTVTADMRFNSDAANTSGDGTLPLIPVAFTATQGTMTPPAGTITASQAVSTFTSTSGSSGTACAMVDNQQICTPITVTAPSFAINDVTHLEGNPPGTTSYVFTVTKTGSTALSSSVNFTTQDGSATQPSDYTLNSGPLNFGPTDTTMQITVLVNRDATFETNEAFNVHLSGAVNATISDADGTGTITNDDAQPTLSINDVSLPEGNLGSTDFAFTVTKAGNATDLPVTVTFATADGLHNGSNTGATGGAVCSTGTDYESQSGLLTFLPTETTMTIHVPVCGDPNYENNELFFVNLVTPTGATIIRNPGTATIQNDDPVTTVSIDDVSMFEGDSGTTNFVFTVTKTGSTELTTTVHAKTANGGATDPSDYTAITDQTLIFPPSSSNDTQTVTVVVNGDTTNEPDELFFVSLFNVSNANIGHNPGVGTIQNDDSRVISGHVAYDDSVTTFGKNVTMTLTGNNGFVTQTTTTDANGDYSFNVPTGNDYTLTPSKVDDVGALHIESLDAAKVARFVAGLDVPTPNQIIAADADGDSLLTSFDAALIARYVAGLPPPTGIVGTWKFVPVNRTYSNFAANQSAQNFTAILVGDTDGNWQPAIPSGGGDDNGLVGISSAQSPDLTVGIPVSLPNVSGAMGSTISVPITVGDVTGQGVKAYDLQVSFNAAIVQPAGTPTDTAGTLSSGMLITPNAMNSGHLIISAFQATPDLTGSGTLINLRFTIVGTAGQVTATTFADYTDPATLFHSGFRFNAGTPAAIPTNGSIHVNGPTAATSTIGGRVTDETGRPVSGVVMNLNGTQSRRTITDADGNYRFDEVETGGFYTVTPSRANYGFSPGQRSFSQTGNNTDAVFTAVANGTNVNPLDTPGYFVRQQYLDFLGREPDEAGFNYWVNNIEACGADSNCLAAKRTDTSAAFFLSTEFQQTGYLVYRMYQSAYGDMPGAPVPLNLSEFRPGRQAIGQGVVVNQSGWEAKLEANKQAFALGFVQRARFTDLYPTTTSPAEFVDSLFRNAGVTPNGSDRTAAIDEFGGLADTADVAARAHAVRLVAENAMLRQQKFNQAFVLMQYFGYLGRDPNTVPDRDFSGYNFWLNKLDSFNGDFRNAEMVKAFLVAGEYRGRFPR